MKIVGLIFLWAALGFCIYNAIYSFWAAIAIYLIIGLLTELVMIPYNYSKFIIAIKKHPSSKTLLEDKVAINIGFMTAFIIGTVVWPFHVSSLVSSIESDNTIE